MLRFSYDRGAISGKYISGLKHPIQERVILRDVISVDEAHDKVLEIEILQTRTPPFRCLAPIEDQQVAQEFNRVPQRLIDRQPASQPTRLLLHQ